MTDSLKQYIKPMPCPICGSMPLLSSADMGRPGGHGYPGCIAYTLNCDCGHMRGSSADTVYSKNSEEAKAKAVKAWNKEVEEVEQLLKHRG